MAAYIFKLKWFWHVVHKLERAKCYAGRILWLLSGNPLARSLSRKWALTEVSVECLRRGALSRRGKVWTFFHKLFVCRFYRQKLRVGAVSVPNTFTDNLRQMVFYECETLSVHENSAKLSGSYWIQTLRIRIDDSGCQYGPFSLFFTVFTPGKTGHISDSRIAGSREGPPSRRIPSFGSGWARLSVMV